MRRGALWRIGSHGSFRGRRDRSAILDTMELRPTVEMTKSKVEMDMTEKP